jgi:hypothetical protein
MEKEDTGEEQEKVKGKWKIIFSIFFTGLAAGFFFGFTKRTGISTSLDSWLTKFIGWFCNTIKIFLSDTSESSCGINWSYVAVIFMVLGIVQILLTAAKLKNWFIGIIVFGVGYLAGFLVGMFF